MKTQRALPINFSGYPLRVADESFPKKTTELQVIRTFAAQQPVSKLMVHPLVGDPAQGGEIVTDGLARLRPGSDDFNPGLGMAGEQAH